VRGGGEIYSYEIIKVIKQTTDKIYDTIAPHLKQEFESRSYVIREGEVSTERPIQNFLLKIKNM